MAATKKQPAATAASTGEPAAAVVDPKFEWAEKAGSYVLRLTLPGFRKDDFRVQVDGAGRLTVRGAKPAATGPGSLHKVFQLPANAAVDEVAGRFEAGVLTLTVPKKAGAGAGAPSTSIEEIKRKQPGVTKEEEIAKEDDLKKAMDEATRKAQEKKQQQEEEEAAKSRKQEQQKAAPAPMKQEEVKPKAAVAPTQKPAPKPQGASSSGKAKAAEEAAKASAAATAAPQKPDAATGTDKPKAPIAPESLAERVRRHAEEEGAKAGQEKQAPACNSGSSWKERVQGELKVLTEMKWAEGLTDMKWADGVVEAARKNKEVVAVGVAAFSLGFLVSHKLFRK